MPDSFYIFGMDKVIASFTHQIHSIEVHVITDSETVIEVNVKKNLSLILEAIQANKELMQQVIICHKKDHPALCSSVLHVNFDTGRLLNCQ